MPNHVLLNSINSSNTVTKTTIQQWEGREEGKENKKEEEGKDEEKKATMMTCV